MFSHKNAYFGELPKFQFVCMFDGPIKLANCPKTFLKRNLGAPHLIDKNILYDLNQICANLFSKCAKMYLALDTNIYYVYLSL